MGKKEFILALARGARGKDAAKALILPDFIGAASSPIGKETLSLTAFAAPTLKTVTKKSKVTSCEVSFTPSQDLHGYANPWPAGGGKNKLENRMSNGTTGGIVYEKQSDGGITAVGVVNSISATRNISRERLPNGTYILSGGNSSINLRVNRYDSDDNLIDRNTDSGSGVTIVIDDTVASLVWMVKAATNDEQVNTTVYPMVRLSTESDATYAPYSNLCPISGWQGAEVTVSGGNLLAPKYSGRTNKDVTYTINSDGTISAKGTASGASYAASNLTSHPELMTLLPAGTYTLTGGVSNGKALYLGGVYKDGTSFTTIYDRGSGATYTFTKEVYVYPQIVISSGTEVDDTFYITLVVGSTASSYVPYRAPSTASVTFGQTVYGGTAEIVAGTGRETWETITLNGTETWGGSGAHGMYTQYNAVERQSNYTEYMMCENLKVYPKYTDSAFTNSDYGITGFAGSSYAGQNWIYIAAAGINNTTDLKAWLAQNPVKVSFVKATPTPYTFPPASDELLLQKGENNAWAEMTNE